MCSGVACHLCRIKADASSGNLISLDLQSLLHRCSGWGGTWDPENCTDHTPDRCCYGVHLLLRCKYCFCCCLSVRCSASHAACIMAQACPRGTAFQGLIPPSTPPATCVGALAAVSDSQECLLFRSNTRYGSAELVPKGHLWKAAFHDQTASICIRHHQCSPQELGAEVASSGERASCCCSCNDKQHQVQALF